MRDTRRTIPIYGEGDDKGVYYRCHHCGFIISKKQNPEAFNDKEAKHGASVYESTDAGSVTLYEYDTKLIGEENHATVIMTQVDAAGDEPDYMRDYTLRIVGCPLCGCRSNRT